MLALIKQHNPQMTQETILRLVSKVGVPFISDATHPSLQKERKMFINNTSSTQILSLVAMSVVYLTTYFQ
jgi:hypothetical protein